MYVRLFGDSKLSVPVNAMLDSGAIRRAADSC